MSPLVLIFDLDHTLFDVLVTQKDKTALSASAEIDAGDDEVSIVSDAPLKSEQPSGNVLKAYKVRAINRTEIAEIFRKIHLINVLATRKEIACPIAVKIITSATYDKAFALQLLDRFYFLDQKILSNETEFPVEYFNYFDLDYKAPIACPSDIATKSGFLDERKELLISKMFPVWQNAMPTLKKSDVVLFDNADSITAAVARKGFTVIHYPTTPKDRLDTLTYSVDGAHALDILDSLVDSRAKLLVRRA